MKVLVVGGAGYIGSHTVRELLRAGHEVVIFDNLSYGNIESIPTEATFVKGDLLIKSDIDEVLSAHTFDIVMHFAARIVVPESVLKPIEYFENNVYGVGLLLKSMEEHGIKNMMFSSTAAVYGEPTGDEVITENFPTMPINPYGESKRAAEDLIRAMKPAYDMNHLIFRYFNVAGADASGEIGLSPKNPPTHLIPVINETILGIRAQTKVYGADYPTADGTCIRDYIHITDLAKAHVLGAEYLLKTGKSTTINLGTNTGFSVMEIIKAAEEVMQTKLNYTIEARRLGDPAVLVASNNRAKELLGWEPKQTVADMIASDYNWRKNPKF